MVLVIKDSIFHFTVTYMFKSFIDYPGRFIEIHEQMKFMTARILNEKI